MLSGSGGFCPPDPDIAANRLAFHRDIRVAVIVIVIVTGIEIAPDLTGEGAEVEVDVHAGGHADGDVAGDGVHVGHPVAEAADPDIAAGGVRCYRAVRGADLDVAACGVDGDVPARTQHADVSRRAVYRDSLGALLQPYVSGRRIQPDRAADDGCSQVTAGRVGLQG